MVLLLEMPPLRERAGDAELLAGHFITRYARHYGVAARQLDARSREWVQAYAWPGNVRELDNLVQRALLLSDGEDLCLTSSRVNYPQSAGWQTVGGNAAPDVLSSFNEARSEALSQFERGYLERLMKAAGGNVTHAARLAGKERRAMGKLLKKHGLARPEFGTSADLGGAS